MESIKGSHEQHRDAKEEVTDSTDGKPSPFQGLNSGSLTTLPLGDVEHTAQT